MNNIFITVFKAHATQKVLHRIAALLEVFVQECLWGLEIRLNPDSVIVVDCDGIEVTNRNICKKSENVIFFNSLHVENEGYHKQNKIILKLLVGLLSY